MDHCVCIPLKIQENGSPLSEHQVVHTSFILLLPHSQMLHMHHAPHRISSSMKADSSKRLPSVTENYHHFLRWRRSMCAGPDSGNGWGHQPGPAGRLGLPSLPASQQQPLIPRCGLGLSPCLHHFWHDRSAPNPGLSGPFFVCVCVCVCSCAVTEHSLDCNWTCPSNSQLVRAGTTLRLPALDLSPGHQMSLLLHTDAADTSTALRVH